MELPKTIAPIPAFYACYLLRSTQRHSALYIGSTPNPPRRLRQHNGDAVGGAVKTSKHSLRPWDMTCLVAGFPSKIAALQFEWAWQNPSLTRHIDIEDRISALHPTTTTRTLSPRSGKPRHRPKRPRASLTDRLRNLHLLLRARSFRRWPLRLTFYAPDIHRLWTKLVAQTTESLPHSLPVVLDPGSPNNNDNSRAIRRPTDDTPPDPASVPPVGIHALDLGYSSQKPQLEKARLLFASPGPHSCHVCRGDVPATGAAALVCPHDGCAAVYHLPCLASAFPSAPDHLLPTQGHCPACRSELHWVDLVKGLSLRMRGEKEIRGLFKAKRSRKGVGDVGGDVAASEADEDPAEVDALWHDLRGESEVDEGPVIEDTCSDWDDVELLT